MPRTSSSNLPSGALLSSQPLFAGLDEMHLKELANNSRIMDLAARQTLFAPGKPIRFAHYLLSGSIKRAMPLCNQAEKILELVKPGQLVAIGEIFSIAHYASQAAAIQPSVLLALDLKVLSSIAARSAALSDKLVRMLAQRTHAAEFSSITHHTLSIDQRVLDYLLNLAGDRRGTSGETTVRLDASKRVVSAQLGMAPESFSRALQLLSNAGFLVVSGRDIHLQNAVLMKHEPPVDGGRRAPARFASVKAEQHEDTLSPAALVNLCGRQRLLSQRLAIVWGVAAFRIRSKPAQVSMKRLAGQFERNLAQLIEQPLTAALSKQRQRLEQAWTEYRSLLRDQAPAAGHAAQVFALSESILQCADALTAAIAEKVGTLEARQVNIAGRNRMLTARLTKLFMFWNRDVRVDEAARLMAASRQEFDANIRQLSAATNNTPQTLDQLDTDIRHWQRFVASIDAGTAARCRSTPDGKAAALGLLDVLDVSEELLRHVDTTVKVYELLAAGTSR